MVSTLLQNDVKGSLLCHRFGRVNCANLYVSCRSLLKKLWRQMLFCLHRSVSCVHDVCLCATTLSDRWLHLFRLYGEAYYPPSLSRKLFCHEAMRQPERSHHVRTLQASRASHGEMWCFFVICAELRMLITLTYLLRCCVVTQFTELQSSSCKQVIKAMFMLLCSDCSA